MLNNHIAEPLKMRFRHPLLIEVVGDRHDLAGDACEVVDVYECPHRAGTYTILHVPAGSLPAGVTAAEPVDRLAYGETDHDRLLHLLAVQRGADDAPWKDAGDVRCWPIRGGESELRYNAAAPKGQRWTEWGAGSYPLRVLPGGTEDL